MATSDSMEAIMRHLSHVLQAFSATIVASLRWRGRQLFAVVMLSGPFHYRSDQVTATAAAGQQARIEGTGRLNGRAGYRFLLEAYAGGGKQGAGHDRLSVRVTHVDAVTGAQVVDYDNRAPATARAALAPERTVLVEGGLRLRRCACPRPSSRPILKHAMESKKRSPSQMTSSVSLNSMLERTSIAARDQPPICRRLAIPYNRDKQLKRYIAQLKADGYKPKLVRTDDSFAIRVPLPH